MTLYFPPAGGGGVQRSLKLAQYLPALGVETHVLAPEDPKWIHEDTELRVPTQAWVHRVRYVGPKARRPAEELHGTAGLERAATQARIATRRLLVPDASVTWNLTAIPAAIGIARRERHRRGDHDVAARLDPLRRRGRQARDGRRLARRRPRRAGREPAPPCRHDCDAGEAGGERPARSPRRALRGRDLGGVGCDRRRAAGARAARRRAHDRERLGLRRLRGPRVPAGEALPHHAHGQLLREAGPAPVPAGARGLGAGRGRTLRGRLPRRRPRVGGGARARRPARADPVLAASRVASAPARLRGTLASRPGGGWARQGRPQREGLRVPRRGAADPRRGAAGRRSSRVDRGDRRRGRRRAGRRRRAYGRRSRGSTPRFLDGGLPAVAARRRTSATGSRARHGSRSSRNCCERSLRSVGRDDSRGSPSSVTARARARAAGDRRALPRDDPLRHVREGPLGARRRPFARGRPDRGVPRRLRLGSLRARETGV